MFKNKIFLMLIILLIPVMLFSIKFNIPVKDKKPLVFQAIFDSGFSAKGISDGAGITDYESIFIKPAFHIQDFGIGFIFDFRFRFILGEFSFLTNQWYLLKGDALNTTPPNADNIDAVNTAFLYLDKIDYIVYGDSNSPVFLNIGINPVQTFGTGLIVNNFHNYAFMPSSREQGLTLKFDGNYLYKYGANTIPFDATLIVNDLLDPDIFILDYGIDVFKFTKLYDKFSLRVGQVYAMDINSTESNRLSSISSDPAVITNYRNLSTTNYNQFTSIPLYSSLYLDFLYPMKYVRLNVFNENSLLLDFLNANYSFANGFGIKIGAELRFIDIKNSGFLLGILAGYILKSPHFNIDNFSSNYEIVRQKEYLSLTSYDNYTNYVMAGIGLYAFQDRLKFKFNVTMPIVSKFACKLSGSFTMENTVVPGLWINVFYETGINTMYIEGDSGQGFIDSITRDFRFSAEFGYKFYGAKLSVLIGIQRQAWVVPYAKEGLDSNGEPQYNPYLPLSEGQVVPDFQIDKNPHYNWAMDLNKYFNDLEKFVSLEISFVF
jgi:hypothetical protein